MAPAENPAFWPLTLIIFLPALVAAGLSLPIIPKAREEIIRWSTLATTAVVFLLSLWVAVPHFFGAVGPGPTATMNGFFVCFLALFFVFVSFCFVCVFVW